MTQTLQPGQHPDADQLSAFAEHALPPHEQQQLLAHLAACSDCRALVFLAQGAVPAAAILPQPAAAHRPWWALFAGWKLAVPAAAALACLVLISVRMHNQAMEDRMNAAVEKTAHLEPAPPPAPPPPAAQPVLKVTPTQGPKPLTRAASPPAINTLETAKAPSAVSFDGNAIQDLALTGRDTTELLKVLPGDKSKTATSTRQSSLGMASFTATNPAPAAAPSAPATITGAIAPRSTAQSPQLAGLSANAVSDQAAANTTAAAPPRPALAAGTALHSLNQQYSATPPLPSAPPEPARQNAALDRTAAHGSVTQTLSVASANAQIEPESNASSAVISAATLGSLQASMGQMAKKQPTLPSRLPAVFTLANAGQQLALDTAGALFRSEDAGVIWHPVAPQWTGRVVKIALAPSSSATAKDDLAAAPAAKTAPAPPQLFQLTNDAGQLWTSPDGQTWKHQ